MFDQGARLRRLLGVDGGVDSCSASYKGGQVAGIIGSFAGGEGEVQFSERVLQRMIEEPGAFHNFPYSIALEALQGEGKVISSNYTLYTLEGAINGVNGAYEVGVNAANQITHYFFQAPLSDESSNHKIIRSLRYGWHVFTFLRM